MFIDTFVKARIQGPALPSITTAYAEWVLGLGDASRSRANRLREGVSDRWSVQQVLDCEPLVGTYGCRVDMRSTPDAMLLRFIHRDGVDGAVFWHTVARVVRHGQQLQVEHVVGRDAPRDYHLEGVASPPRIVTSLLNKDGIEVRPVDLALPIVRLTGDDVQGFVEHVLLRADREIPIVLVACERGGGPPLLDASRLADRLRGICAVGVLATAKATFEFSDALAAKGYPRELRCYDGAVHTYGAASQIRDDHRLWLGDGIRELEERRRADVVAGLLARRIALRTAPQGVFTLIEEHDREERRALAERLSRKASKPPPPPGAATPEYVSALEQEQVALRTALQTSLVREKEYVDIWTKADDELQLAQRQKDDAEARLEQSRGFALELQEQLQRAKAASAPALSAEFIGAARAVLTDQLTAHDCLMMLQLAYGERVVILEGAFDSAKDVAKFRRGSKLLGLLVTLAGAYWESLAAGKGDTVAGKLFGKDAFAATESEVTKNNKRAIDERTFSYKGKKLVMWPHLKIGVKETTAETIRVHFEWIADEKKIVVGHCGKHRYRVT